jgi:hypothetical protein
MPLVWGIPKRQFVKYLTAFQITTITTARQRNYNPRYIFFSRPSYPRLSFDFAQDGSKDGERSRTKWRGRLRIGAFSRSHHCWRFVVYVVVVLLRPRLWTGSASQGLLGGLKEARGGCCGFGYRKPNHGLSGLCRKALLILSVFKSCYLFLPQFCLLIFSLLPPSTSQKTKTQGKIFGCVYPPKEGVENFAQGCCII